MTLSILQKKKKKNAYGKWEKKIILGIKTCNRFHVVGFDCMVAWFC